SEYVDQLRARSKHGFHCEHCGTYSIRRPGGANESRGYRRRWCSMSCRKAAASRLSNETAFLRGLARANQLLAAAAKAEERRTRREEEREAYLRRALVACCARCGIAFEQRTWLGTPEKL